MNQPIDLDAEAIWHEDRWIKKDELAAAIRTKLEKGDFTVAALSGALERLHQAVSAAKVVTFRLDLELADALAAHAQRSEVGMGVLLRQAVAALLGGGVQAEPVSPEELASAVTLRPKSGAHRAAEDVVQVERTFFQGER